MTSDDSLMEPLVPQNPTFHDRIAKAGPMNALVELLKHGIAPAKDYALWSLSLSITRADQPVIAEAVRLWDPQRPRPSAQHGAPFPLAHREACCPSSHSSRTNESLTKSRRVI